MGRRNVRTDQDIEAGYGSLFMYSKQRSSPHCQQKDQS